MMGRMVWVGGWALQGLVVHHSCLVVPVVLQVCMVQVVVLDMHLVEDGALELPDLGDHPGNPPHSVPAVQASVEAAINS
ncbi:hypothetical protein E2C01_004287 [Portunus trituberculatus]|uniref:Uncharacterized protein n=1 Tax=Portunus trituberculatus TaxID=210409 RepID=A0A5B7CPI4_PORTR|nr:hypothetical protein [Portunus trituberculatus]